MALLCRFSLLRISEYSLAILISVVVNNFIDFFALLTLPVAFNRGAILKTISDTFSSFSCKSHALINSANPILISSLFIFFIPLYVKIRFSSLIGTMSAAVPRATRSKKSVAVFNRMSYFKQ